MLAQVYKAVLRDTGEEVAIKVQRPGVEPVILRDLFIFRSMARFINPICKVESALSRSKHCWEPSHSFGLRAWRWHCVSLQLDVTHLLQGDIHQWHRTRVTSRDIPLGHTPPMHVDRGLTASSRHGWAATQS